eukprot:EG_transcript_26634
MGCPWAKVYQYTFRAVAAAMTLAILCLNVVLLVDAAYLVALSSAIDKTGYVFLRIDGILLAIFIILAELELRPFLKLAPALRYWPCRGLLHMFLGSLGLQGYGMAEPAGDTSVKVTIQVMSFFMIGLGVAYILVGAIWHRPAASPSPAVANLTDLEAEAGKVKPTPEASKDAATSSTPPRPTYMYK